ncbi:hypothetical protein AQI88_36075 [Streptomyces cellostaticus]|uniref:Uncharacterized protein n=1 Tax=Streptomyces cellostaticus TaxID=67285 RepID=A0A101NEJ4_9ACTN|nr:hypothetical protein [Streptomyces cellostaticus]KUM91669.1 hypothetical protein AQI88_36075 [Streptomyces cellostaticus]GHI03678.1 hypothetical protein Scel_19990 [Streptomyces cellostaticus]
MPIFIRCPRHLMGDDKFGQICDLRDLAEERGQQGRERAEIRLPVRRRRRQDLPMLLTDTILPPTFAAVLAVRGQQQPGRPRRPGPARP